MTTIATVANPYGEIIATPNNSNDLATAGTDSNRAIAEVQAAMAIAKRFPRDERRAMDRILNACQRPGLANQAVYEYSRGGSSVSGPSIRLAEALAQNWGNIQFGTRELSTDGRQTVVLAYAFDAETNTRVEKTFTVRHWRDTRKGGYAVEGQRDTYELVANMGARRLRACILAVIPGDVTEAAVEQCETTMRAKADTSPEGVKKLLAAFADLGVTAEQVATKIQRHIDAITPAQVVHLRKVYKSIKDGMGSPLDYFDPIEGADDSSGDGTGTEALKAAVKSRAKKAAKADPDPTPLDAIPTGAELAETMRAWAGADSGKGKQLSALLRDNGLETSKELPGADPDTIDSINKGFAALSEQ